MKLSTILALCAAALAADSTAAEQLSGIVPNSYIAIADASACGEVAHQVSFQQQSLDGPSFSVLRGAAAPEPTRSFKIGNSCFISFSGSARLQSSVSAMSSVQSVEPNQYVTTLAPASWGLDRIDQTSLPLNNGAFQSAFNGAGQRVYVIDTGINKGHNDFSGRAFYGGDFVNEANPTDNNGHGSHCAGTVAGSTYGVAKKAIVIGVKVLNSAGSGTYASIISGISWAVNNAGSRSSVLSMSLGGGKSAAVENAVKSASNAGHIVVVAAGNNNGDACSKSPAGAGGSGSRGGVITVGSTDSRDARSGFSNYGKCTDISAPGSSIKSVWKWSNTATNTISGTSMACPHVAGIAATLLQKHYGNKAAAVSELFRIAVNGKIIGLPYATPNKLAQTVRRTTRGLP